MVEAINFSLHLAQRRLEKIARESQVPFSEVLYQYRRLLPGNYPVSPVDRENTLIYLDMYFNPPKGWVDTGLIMPNC